LLGILWRRFKTLLPRALMAGAAVFQIAPFIVWAFVFGG